VVLGKTGGGLVVEPVSFFDAAGCWMFMDVWMMQIGCKKKSETKQSCKFYVVPTEYLYIYRICVGLLDCQGNQRGGQMLNWVFIRN